MAIKIAITFVYHGKNHMILDTRDFRMKISIRHLDMLKYLDTRHCDKVFHHKIQRIVEREKRKHC